MNRGKFSLCLLVALALAAVAAPPAGRRLRGIYTVVPLKNQNDTSILAQSSTGATIPMWTYSITAAKDGHAYSGFMVGRSPFGRGKTTTTIPTVIVPLVFTISGTTFDPTAVDACFGPNTLTDVQLVQGSPILQNTSFTMNGVSVGNTQYVDAFQRANFWTDVSGSPYHTMLSSPVTVLAAQTVPASVTGAGLTGSFGRGAPCGELGVVKMSTLDNWVRTTLFPALSASVAPNNFPILLTHNIVMSSGAPSFSSGCCILGYHGATGAIATQTYGVVDFDVSQAFTNTSDVSVMAHEVGEWMDDPLGTNPTPNWGNIGQVSGCQSNLEVGDPLSGAEAALVSALMPNGVTYNMQELAFFNWFFGGASLGSGGKFSSNGKFAGSSKACPPGGTN